MIKSLPAVAVLVAVLCACGPAQNDDAMAESWAAWRGPYHDGSARPGGFTSGSIPSLSVDWEAPLGAGYSGIAVVDGLAVTMFSDGEADHVVALAVADGSERWRFPLGPTYRRDHSEADDGPAAMPTIHGDTVYGVGPRGDLFALRLEDGREIWKLSMTEAFAAPAPPYGFATSPVVVDGTLIVQTGAGGGNTTIGLDAESGETLWSHGDDGVEYQSPLIRTAESGRYVAVVTDLNVVGLDPATGSVLWSNPHVAQVRDGYAQVLFHDGDRMIGYYLTHVMGYRLTEADGHTDVEEIWRSLELKANLTVPVVTNGKVCGFQVDRLTCFDALTGEKVWRDEDEEREGRGILLLDELLVVWDADGVLRVVDPAGEVPREVTRIETGLDNGYAALSYAAGRIFLRNATKIAAVRISTQ